MEALRARKGQGLRLEILINPPGVDSEDEEAKELGLAPDASLVKDGEDNPNPDALSDDEKVESEVGQKTMIAEELAKAGLGKMALRNRK